MPERFDLAGFTDAYSRLGKKIPAGEIYVSPNVVLDSDHDRLFWHFSHQRDSWVKPTPSMFDGFVQLWQHPERIHLFAKKWGPLGMDELGRLTARVVETDHEGYNERLETWRFFSRRAFSALSIAANLKQGKPGRPDDWAALSSLNIWLDESLQISFESHPLPLSHVAARGCERLAKAPIRTQKTLLPLEVTLWLKFSVLGFMLMAFDRGAARWEFRTDYQGRLIAAIALQLALTISGTDTLYICSGCSNPYVRRGKSPRLGQLNFCPECGRGAALRQADYRRRERIQEARRLHVIEGKSAAEIAKLLNVHGRGVQTVRDWIAEGKCDGKKKTRK